MAKLRLGDTYNFSFFLDQFLSDQVNKQFSVELEDIVKVINGPGNYFILIFVFPFVYLFIAEIFQNFENKMVFFKLSEKI